MATDLYIRYLATNRPTQEQVNDKFAELVDVQNYTQDWRIVDALLDFGATIKQVLALDVTAKTRLELVFSAEFVDDAIARKLAVWMARQAINLITDERCFAAIVAAENFADGKITHDEMREAHKRAWVAAREAAERQVTPEQMRPFAICEAMLRLDDWSRGEKFWILKVYEEFRALAIASDQVVLDKLVQLIESAELQP